LIPLAAIQWRKRPLGSNLNRTSRKKCGGRESVRAKIVE
jgi:hypothetical protein